MSMPVDPTSDKTHQNRPFIHRHNTCLGPTNWGFNWQYDSVGK